MKLIKKNPAKIKITYIYNYKGSGGTKAGQFVHDIDLLKNNYDLYVIKYKGLSDIPRIIYSIMKTDLNISWFAHTYSVIAVISSKILGKKSIVISGGYDAANVKDIINDQVFEYGNMRNPITAWISKFSFKYADKVLAVSKSTMKEILEICIPKDIEVAYCSIYPEKFRPIGKKKNMVLTTSMINENTLLKKGLITFVKSAEYLPNTEFILLGPYEKKTLNYLKSISTPNVKFKGYVSEKRYIKYLQEAKIYVQVSLHESFGISVAEAISCEAIPVVTKKFALPEVVGKCGLYVPPNNPKALATAIKMALKHKNNKMGRKRVVEKFSSEMRQKKLNGIINNLIKQ